MKVYVHQETHKAATPCYRFSQLNAITQAKKLMGDTGFEGDFVSPYIGKTCEEHEVPVRAKFGAFENLPSIPVDMAVVINAWEYLSAKGKKDILAIVRQEHVNSRGE